MASITSVLLCLSLLTLAAATAPVVDLSPLRLYICSEKIIRVVYDAPGFTVEDQPSFMISADWSAPQYTVSNVSGVVTVATSALHAAVDLATLEVTFTDALDGHVILAESGREFTKTTDQGATAYAVQQNWAAEQKELLFGGGQFQNGLVQYHSAPLNLEQVNKESMIPYFLNPEKRVGVLWDSNALLRLNPATEEITFTNTTTTTFTSTAAGRYYFRVVLAAEAPHFGADNMYTYKLVTKVSIQPHQSSSSSRRRAHQASRPAAATVIVDYPAATVKPAETIGRVDLAANTVYDLTFVHGADGSSVTPAARLFVRRPEQATTTSLWSQLSNGVDYYMMYAPASSSASSQPAAYLHRSRRARKAAASKPAVSASAPVLTAMDDLIALYREATGTATMYPKWVFGFWQCQDRYQNQAQLLADAHGYRNRSAPMDNIVQDWQYWGSLGWGPHWDPSLYPDPAGMVEELHGLHVQLMVTSWSRYDSQTEFYKNASAEGALISNSNGYFDIYRDDTRALYYSYPKKYLLDIGVDALWLDSSEPEGLVQLGQKLNQGAAGYSGNRLVNPYPLMVIEAIAAGQRAEYPDRRVYTLARSSFPGAQRAGGCVWSGDTEGTWDELRRQVGAGLTFQSSGMPWWSQDLGGWFRPNDQYTSADYSEMLTRWFQLGVFTPVFRVHGGSSTTAIWHYGEATYENLLLLDHLRYRLLPYVYTLASWVTRFHYTMQRVLAFDFVSDAAAVELSDEFMFGPAFLVAPVTTAKLTSRSVYVPASGKPWINFFSGETVSAAGGESIEVDATIPEYPVLVQAGSIVPMGPYLNYTSEKPADPLELRIYPGADGSFTLYEDDGVTRAAEKQNAFAEITFAWNDAASTLTVGARSGSFDGMLSTRTLHVVLVSADHGVGVAPTADADVDKIVTYNGQALTVQL